MSEKKLTDAVSEIEKRFGKGTLVALDSTRTEAFPVISTGNDVIDGLTGIGGFPKGRIVEIDGLEGGGKTTLCLQVVAQAQKAGGVCVYIDAEHTLDPEYAAKLGVDTTKLLLCQPDSGEDALEVALCMVRSGAVSVVVIDSVSALVPRKELEGDIGDAQMGLQARMMSQAMRMLTKAVADSGTLLIFINQIRMKIGVMFGNPETTSGGFALKFAASMRIDVRRIGQKKKGDVVIGADTLVKIIKNKLAAPYKKAEILLIYGEGFSNQKKNRGENSMSMLKVGQKVRVLGTLPVESDSNDPSRAGKIGTVVDTDNRHGKDFLGVEFEDNFTGHWAKGHGMSGHCWYIQDLYLESIPPAPSDALFPNDAKARKEIPLASGVLDYFTSALIEVAKVSFEGNKQHNPGEPLHWARGKSTDQADTLLRHFVERGTLDTDGVRHSAKMVWRALALLQLELEAAGAPLARGAK